MNFSNLLAEWWHAISATGTGLLGLATYGKRRLDRVDERSKQNQRQLQGDPDDPNTEGALQMIKETRERVEHLDEKMDEQHSEVLDRVDDLAKERRDHD